MPELTEGYVFHSYGPARYVRAVVASALTLRRHDAHRRLALYAPASHREELARYGLDTLFDVLEDLPEEHRSIVGFKLHLDRFMPFDRCLYVDADMIWCRDPAPLWNKLSEYRFTATGLERADFFFGGPKGVGIVADILLDRRRRTMKRFGLTHLPRVQAGMIYASDYAATREACETARGFLARREETHFRSRLAEGRSEESCEWSLAMAMSKLRLPILPWMNGYESPQVDYIDTHTEHDADFEDVRCRFYCDSFVYELRGIKAPGLRSLLTRMVAALPGKGDYLEVTPYTIHFGWLHQKATYNDFTARTWERVTGELVLEAELALSGDSAAKDATAPPPVLHVPVELGAKERAAVLLPPLRRREAAMPVPAGS
jgi:hypothetical protein